MMCMRDVASAWSRRGAALLALFVVAHGTAEGQTLDRVRLIAGGTERGEVQRMTHEVVQLRQSSGTKSIPVNEIQTIQFDREPIELTQARSQIRNGAYREAVETLARLRPAELRRSEVRQDVEYYSAAAQAHSALESRDEQALRSAGRALHEFVTTNRRNYHYYEGMEILGDILAALGQPEDAQSRYAALASAPWPEYAIRAGVLEGRALAAQEKHAEAIKRFDQALSIESDAPGVAEQKLAASLGRARSQAATGDAEQAIKAVEQVISEADPEALKLQARAHNVLGQCQLQAGSDRDALYAFLYVDVLCSGVRDAHAEALFHLIPLLQRLGRDEDSRQARERLLEQYPESVWAKELARG